MLTILLNLSGKILLLVALGFGLRKTGIISGQFQKDLTSFLMQVAVPSYIMTVSGNTLSPERTRNILAIVLLAVVFYIMAFLLCGLISKAFRLEGQMKTAFTIMAVYANTAFVGFPLAAELLGEEGLLYAISYNMVWVLCFFTIGISLMAGQTRLQLSSIFKVPVSVASIISIAIFLSPFRLPAFIMDTFSTLGGMVVPVSMLLIGCSLVEVRLTEILTDRMAYLVSGCRLVVFPLLTLLLMLCLPFLPGLVRVVACLMSCLPTATLCVVFAQKYDCEPHYVSRATVQTMVLMIPAVLLYLRLVLAVIPV